MKKSDATAVERPYHHGDLRRAIVEAALDTLRETQSVDFSLRELARRAGVSHNAPYKHFAEKRDLLAAVSAAGFESLTKRMANESAKPGSPRARLLAMARAYVSHGVENPALYRLMFGGYLSSTDEGRPPIERAAAEEAKALLCSAIVDGALRQPIPNTAKNERKLNGQPYACSAAWADGQRTRRAAGNLAGSANNFEVVAVPAGDAHFNDNIYLQWLYDQRD